MNRQLKPYPNYKPSGIPWLGDVPENWGIERSKYLLREINERSMEGDELLLGVSEYTGVTPRSDLIEDGDFLSRADSLEGYKKCKSGDLVINIMLAWKRGLGVTKTDGIVSPAYCVFRSDSKKLNSFFSHYLFRSDIYVSEFGRSSSGVIPSRWRMYPEDFGRVMVLFPSLEEQKIIAEFLDQSTANLDDLIAQKKHLIELLKEKRQALITQAVTKGLNPNVKMKDSGVPWLGQIPEHWEVLPLKWMCNKISGGVTPPSENLEYFEDGTIDWFGPSDFNDDIFLASSDRKITTLAMRDGVARLFPGGSVLVIGIGGTLGKVGYFDQPYSTNQQILNLVIDQNRSFPIFIAYHLKMFEKVLLDQALYTTMPIMNQEEMGCWPIALPPLEEQESILKIVKKINEIFSLLKNLEKEISVINEYRQSLISAVVTGKIDLREWKAS